MKTLIIYYSFEGNTEFVADLVAKETQADVLKLEPLNEKKPKGFMKYLWGGKQVFTKAKPPLKPLGKDPMSYELLIIGTPVWANSYTPAIRSFLDKANICGKKIALFCCCQAYQGHTFQDIKRRIPDNEFVSQIVLKDPLVRNKEANTQKVQQWCRDVLEVK